MHVTVGEAYRYWLQTYDNILRWREDGSRWLFVHTDQMLDGSAAIRLEDALNGTIDMSHVDSRLNRSRAGDEAPAAATKTYRHLCRLAGWTQA